MKLILIFRNNELINQIQYKTKKEAKGNYMIFKKYGVINPQTGDILTDCTIELI